MGYCSRGEPGCLVHRRSRGVNTAKVIDALNKAVSVERTAIIQYQQHSLLVRGLWRKVFADFFAAQSLEAHSHARTFGHKTVALGGVPTVELGTIRQTLDLEEMLQLDLELERSALQAYLNAHAVAEEDVALRNMLEEQIDLEQRDVEELELLLDLVKTGQVEKAVTRPARARK